MKTPSLHRREEFEAILGNYHISEGARQILNETPFVVMVAPSASGRNTIINELLKTEQYHFIVSDTTRPPRVNNGVLEQNGVEYFFRDEDDMLADIEAGRFLEAEVIHKQQVSGISVREIEKAHKMGKIAITDVDLGGAQNIAKTDPTAIVIFVVPPNFNEWLRRMRERGSISDEEVCRRVETAIRHFRAVLNDDRFICVVNDDLQKAVNEVDVVATQQQVDVMSQNDAHQIVKILLGDAEDFIAQAKNA
ncbi:MAG: hypothetical protein PVI21_00255 [Candidatus Woesebacteria bacterium]|jgi:guanylate kinase